ncbi:MAG TPA: response regulator, partial [Spirochaetota bacterium]|nr:response regulator [Spirochaetota bacterium]
MPDILVVDDNEANRYYLESLLGGHGYTVASAADGQAALECARRDRPRLVIADILMPVMDGYALCREWRLDQNLNTVPFVFYTATYTDDKDAEFALKLGADRFLIKPLPPDDLIAIIKELISGPILDHALGEDFLPESFKGHNEVLLRKLYKKMNDLQRSNDLLEQEIRSRRETEAQLVHAQKMEAVGRLAGGIAHDLNNILTAMYGLGQLLGESLGNETLARGYLHEMVVCMDRAAALSRSILSVSRRQEMEMRTLDLNEVVRGLEMIVRQILGRTIEYETRLGAERFPVRADRGQIEQVLMNLVVNARDAMPEGGRLVIGTWSVADGRVLLEVRDSGTGMDESVRQRIFEPFFTTKDVGKGTGLGLS